MHTTIITNDYLDLGQALNHAMARLVAAPQTAKDAARDSLAELYRLQDGVLSSAQVLAVSSAALSAATANKAHFDTETQTFRQCCDICGGQPESYWTEAGIERVVRGFAILYGGQGLTIEHDPATPPRITITAEFGGNKITGESFLFSMAARDFIHAVIESLTKTRPET